MADTDIAKINIVTYGKLTRFYLPLLISAISISMTHFIINIALGKLPDPDLYISAYNTSRSLVLVFQSIGVCLAYVVTTFIVNEATFIKVTKYSIFTLVILTVIFLSIAFTPLSHFIFSDLYNLSGELLNKAIIITRFIIFFSLSVCIRHYFVGMALRLRYNPFISIASFCRLLVVIVLNLFMVSLIKNINNDYLPGLMLVLCGFTEAGVIAVCIFIYNKDLKRSVVNACKKTGIYDEKADIKYSQIIAFTAPIILSFMLGKLVPGVTNSALALAENNEKVIAAFSIAMVIVNMISSFMMSFQHIIINHDSFNVDNRRIIKNFAIILSVIGCSILCFVAFTPLGDYILIDIFNALPSTARLSKIMLRFMVLNPIFMVYTNFYYGYLLKIKKTKLLIFQRVISSLIPYLLFVFIKFVPWEYVAAMGGIVICICNLSSGIYNNIIYRIITKNKHIESVKASIK